MLRVLLVVLLNVFVLIHLPGQVVKYYTLENGNFEKVDITLTATSNSCCIKPTANPFLVSLFGFENNSTPKIYTVREQGNNIECLFINLNDPVNQRGTSLSQKFFASSTSHNDHWDLYLADEKPMRLMLNYAVGDASVDLSNLPIERLKINTGSAEVNVSYMEGRLNPVKMDTFFVKVDLGSLTVKKMNYSQAQTVIADVNFGALILEYSDLLNSPSNVSASVGAGNLIIGLPEEEEYPVIINIHNSPLCHVKLPRHFKKIKKHTYVNDIYHKNAPNILSFDLDVAVGQIKFVKSK